MRLLQEFKYRLTFRPDQVQCVRYAGITSDAVC